MSRLPLIGLLLAGVIFALACSGSGDSTPTIPDLDAMATPSENHVAWGVFDVAYDLENGSAEVVWNRQAELHLNVTGAVTPPNCYTCISVVNSLYDAPALKFYLEVAFINPTPITGYDVRAIISDLGGEKVLLNPDGVTSVWGAPMPFKAVNVDPERTFGAFEVHGRTFNFYFPPGEKFATMTYILDASWPAYVEEPLVEQGYSDPVINNGFGSTFVRAFIWDHQGNLNPQLVYADLMLLGGSPQTFMYDDGQHNDGVAGDGIYGTPMFTTTVPVGIYMVNIVAFDLSNNLGWGQVLVSVMQTTGGPNDDPVILDITADRTTANGSQNEKCLIAVEAMDPNGDPLAYDFQGSGSFTPTAKDNEVYWKPVSSTTGPQPIDITVLDDKGGMAAYTITLWSTDLSIVPGSTSGMIPGGTIQSLLPVATLDMGNDFMGQVCYINFWATTCGYCIAEMPELTQVYNKYKNSPGYNHILMDVNESESKVMNFINSHDYACTYWALDVGASYFSKCKGFNGNSGGIPQHVLFDRDGRCRWAHLGKLPSTTDLENAIDQLL